MPICAKRGAEIGEHETVCSYRETVAESSIRDTRPVLSIHTVTNTVFLLACAALVISTFLPWASSTMASRSAVEWTGNDAYVLAVLGALGVLVSILALALRHPPCEWIFLGIGCISLGLSLYYLSKLVPEVEGLRAQRHWGHIWIGAGPYVVTTASSVVLAAALILVALAIYRKRTEASAKPPILNE